MDFVSDLKRKSATNRLTGAHLGDKFKKAAKIKTIPAFKVTVK